MKTREEMISEIVGEFDAKFRNGATSTKRNDEIESFLRSALLKISDASMDAVEVEEKEHICAFTKTDDHCYCWNAARTASQEKRKEWCEIKS